MTDRRLLLLATAGSVALLGGAFVFQWLGWPPCAMCLWQRWPHALAILLGLAALAVAGTLRVVLAAFGALAALTTAGIAAYHSGVERKWWEGPASCSGSGGGLGDLSGAELVPGGSEMPALVLCDTFTPFFAGLSMANWNMILSLGLTLVWILAVRRAFSSTEAGTSRST